MLYHLSLFLKNYIHFFNVFHYITVRLIASLLTSLFLTLIFGSVFIYYAKKWFSSKVRQYTPDSHKIKDYTPTMGGILILASSMMSMLLWCNLKSYEVWIFLFCLICFGLIGFWDDFYKIKYNKGISERKKFLAQILVALIVILLWLWLVKPNTALCFPFIKNLCPKLGLLIIPWAIFILVGTSNAVNLTDGLDGLAISALLLNFCTYSIICYLASNLIFSWYLGIIHTTTSEIAIIGMALFGSSLGFLWYNAYPAQIFMGDIGSLSLGAALALMAIMSRQELLLPISGGLFVLETVSVILQVSYYKLFKQRIFKMAPIHHHFELLGWQECKITIRFAIITFILCLFALATLKLR